MLRRKKWSALLFIASMVLASCVGNAADEHGAARSEGQPTDTQRITSYQMEFPKIEIVDHGGLLEWNDVVLDFELRRSSPDALADGTPEALDETAVQTGQVRFPATRNTVFDTTSFEGMFEPFALDFRAHDSESNPPVYSLKISYYSIHGFWPIEFQSPMGDSSYRQIDFPLNLDRIDLDGIEEYSATQPAWPTSILISEHDPNGDTLGSTSYVETAYVGVAVSPTVDAERDE